MAMRPDLSWYGKSRSQSLRGCVEAVEVRQGEGERCGVGRATRNVINIGTHVDVTLGDGGDEGVQGQTKKEGRQRTALFQPVGHLNPCFCGGRREWGGQPHFRRG